MLLSLLAAGLLAGASAPVPGQDQGQDQVQGQSQQSAVEANNEVAGAFAARDAAQADAQAQYQADMTAYRAALARRDRRADADEAHYAHQQRAYADAMRDWRTQDRACRRGSSRACRAPAPDPADYW